MELNGMELHYTDFICDEHEPWAVFQPSNRISFERWRPETAERIKTSGIFHSRWWQTNFNMHFQMSVAHNVHQMIESGTLFCQFLYVFFSIMNSFSIYSINWYETKCDDYETERVCTKRTNTKYWWNLIRRRMHLHTKLNSFAFNGDLSELELQVGTENNLFFFLFLFQSNS